MNQSQPLSIPEMMRQTARDYATHDAIMFTDHGVTFDEVDARSDRVAAYLASVGIQKGDRVAVYCINCAEFAIAYAGIIKAGAIVVPVNLLLSQPEVAYVLKDSGVKGLFFHPLFATNVAAVCAELSSLSTLICIGEPAQEVSASPLSEVLASTGDVPVVSFDPLDDLAAILYTSGTTGYPKGAMLTHHNLVSNTRSVLQALELQPGVDCLLVVLPMFHSFAATVGMLTPLLHGVSFAPVPKFDPAAVSEVIAKVGATVFLGVPSMYSVLLRLPEAQLQNWKSIRYCVSGGAAMPVAVMQQFEARFGLAIHEGDGPTECSPVTCVNPMHGVRKPASVGLPIPDVEMEIFGKGGVKLGVDQIGEICVRGPNVMKGYWNLPEATADSFYDEWVRTGDLGTIDSDGYIFIVDRIKDMIIVNGMNVYPRMVEEALYRHPQIAEAAVVGEPSDLHGETVVAHVVAKENEVLSVAEIKSYCKDNLGRHEIPRKIIIQSDLPKNAAGKILKRELRRAGELERGVDNSV